MHEIFDVLSLEESFRPYVRRAIGSATDTPIDSNVRITATGYNYLCWFWRGRWRGTVDGQELFDTSRDGPVFVSGQVTKRTVRGHFSGRVAAIFLEFQPFGMYQLMDIDGDELVNIAAPPDRLNPSLSDFVAKLRNPVDSPASMEQAIEILCETLAPRLKLPNPIGVSFLNVARMIEQRSGIANIGEICSEFGVPERTFRRYFSGLVGLPPKKFGNIVRANNAFRALIEAKLDPKEIAAAYGYSDQSHMIRSFNTLLHKTPEGLRHQPDPIHYRFVGMSQPGSKASQ